MERDKIDRFDARWLAAVPPATSRDLLPDHPWLGRQDLFESGLIVAGTSWAVCADLMVEPVDRLPRRPPRPIALRGVVSMARHHGAPLGPSDLASFDGSTGQLDVIHAGTELRVIKVSGWVDWMFPSVGTYIQFAVPNGRQFTLHTHEANADRRPIDVQEDWIEGIEWWMLACAAVIVPAAHPFARDQALVGDALQRIGAAAHAAVARCSSEPTPEGCR